jgi:alanyl-tRNA synthetase
VITDHARAAAFLIADGVVPGNTGRNYVSRMIIRRAARFGSLMGLDEPFLAIVAQSIIENYGEFYNELPRNQAAILDNITREERRFQQTVEAGVSKLEGMLDQIQADDQKNMAGERAFDLYATYGLPLEITRDIAREQDIEVDVSGFQSAMEQHRLASGAGEVFGTFGDENIELYQDLLDDLEKEGKIGPQGILYDPYDRYEVEGEVLGMIRNGTLVQEAGPGDQVEILLPDTPFYVEAGGQVSDTGKIFSTSDPSWEIRVEGTRMPATGVIIHLGEVVSGKPAIGDRALAQVEVQRRLDIMRNHTATHLLHAELRAVLGDHARQAGSLVAPDRLRFDFTHPEALTKEQLQEIEAGVNQFIFRNYALNIVFKPLQVAIDEGATALFGEKYADNVRTITIGGEAPFSYELCGGTHVSETADIGTFLITSESSVGAGLRRIEAVTGHGAYKLVQHRFALLEETASLLETNSEQVVDKTETILNQLDEVRKQVTNLRREMGTQDFNRLIEQVPEVNGVPVLIASLPNADAETLREMSDRFRQQYPSSVALLASVSEGRPVLIATVTDDLVARGLHAGELVKYAADPLGGSGGGRPTLAQAGGKHPDQIEESLAKGQEWIQEKL